jgi:hypothetical protein
MEPSKDDGNTENSNALIIVEKQETNSESTQKSTSVSNILIFYLEN